MIRRFRCPVCQCYIGRRDGRIREHIHADVSAVGNRLQTRTCPGSGEPATEQYQAS